MNFYIADCPYNTAISIKKALLSLGHKCTSRWIEEMEFTTHSQPIDKTRFEIAVQAQKDILAGNHGLILVASPKYESSSPYKHVETGIALGYNYKILIIGRCESVFYFHPNIQTFETQKDLINFIQLKREILE